MSEIKSNATTMKGLKFKQAEKEGDRVRVQMKDFNGVLKIRKWNYKTKRWSGWSNLLLMPKGKRRLKLT